MNAMRAWLCAALLGLPVSASAQDAWTDPSPHHVRMVQVAADVQLEVLDWGGAGRPLVLLAGAGNSAHVFDEFAPLLKSVGRVLAITRRGAGASDSPPEGYTADRLGEDVVAAIDALGLSSPVLIGHSIAGQELSYIATRHASRIAGAVYLDAGYRYALFRPGIKENVQDLRRRLDALEAELDKPPRPPTELAGVIQSVMGDALTEVDRDMRDLTTTPEVPGTPPRPADGDLRSVAAFRDWSRRTMGYALPEAELRLTRTVGADGVIGPPRPASPGAKALTSAGAMRFTTIGVPALAIYASPHGLGPWSERAGVDRAKVDAFARFDEGMTERQARWFERTVPGARVVRIRNASHYVFISHADEVSAQIAAFVGTLGQVKPGR